MAYEVMEGPATVFGDELTLTGVGMVTVRAKHLGNAGYLAASAVDRPFNVTQGSQSVEIKVPAQVTWQSEPYEVGLKASSGLTNFKLEVLTGPAEVVEGNKLKLTGVGLVKLILSEPGDERYRVALVQDEFEVVKATQTIEFGELADASYRIEPIKLGAMASSGGKPRCSTKHFKVI